MIYLFYCDITNAEENYDLIHFCDNRKKYLECISDNFRYKQSFFVWKLLLYAVNFLGVKNANFAQTNEKWEMIGEKYKFCLSHSKNIVCVSISERDNSVDVELLSSKILNVRKKISKTANNIYELTKIWTEKESLIKEPKIKLFKHFKLYDILGGEYDACVGFLDENASIILKNIEIKNLYKEEY